MKLHVSGVVDWRPVTEACGVDDGKKMCLVRTRNAGRQRQMMAILTSTAAQTQVEKKSPWPRFSSDSDRSTKVKIDRAAHTCWVSGSREIEQGCYTHDAENNITMASSSQHI